MLIQWRVILVANIIFILYLIMLYDSKDVSVKKYLRRFSNDSCYIPPLSDMNDFYNYINTPTTKCNNLVAKGGAGGLQTRDGVKFVCLDERFQMNPGKCVVLSFGIGKDFSFDDAMGAYGCNVYSFDPTNGLQNHTRSERVQFFSLGLSDNTGEIIVRNTSCKVDRYENILKELNLLDKPINYLKMDIEGHERDFFDDIFMRSTHLLKNIQQIGMEIHLGKPPKIESMKTLLTTRFYTAWMGLHLLECHGFRLVYTEKNRHPKTKFLYKGLREEATGYEVVLIKS